MALYPRKTGLNGRLERKRSSSPQPGDGFSLTGEVEGRQVTVCGIVQGCCNNGTCMVELDDRSRNLLAKTLRMKVGKIVPEQELRKLLAVS